MKAFIKYLLVLQFALTGFFQQGAYAQETFEITPEAIAAIPHVSQKTADYRVKFASATYAINEIPAMLSDLNDMALGSQYAISKSISAEIYKRLDAAMTLVSIVMQDPQLENKQKFELTADLASMIGRVLLTILRQHGEDKVDSENLMKRLSEMKSIDHAKEIVKEFIFDVKNLVVPAYSASSKQQGGREAMWGPSERGNRNELGLKTLGLIQNYGKDVLPQITGELHSHDKKEWIKVLDVGLRLREYRLNAQKTTAYTYMGFALWGLIAPHVDTVGLFTGYNDNTLFTSSLVYFSAWAVAGTIKWGMTSAKTVNALKDTIKFLEDPNAVVAPQSRMSIGQKLANLGKKAANSCRLLIGRKSAAAKD